MKNIGKSLDDITNPIFSKNGFVDQRIIKYWPFVVGESLARYTSPLKIVFTGGRTRGGVLHIGISNPSLALELQSQEGRFIEKISTYFGYQAVSRIRLVIEKKAGKKVSNDNKLAKIKISDIDQQSISQMLKDVKDPELNKVLRSLSEGLFESSK